MTDWVDGMVARVIRQSAQQQVARLAERVGADPAAAQRYLQAHGRAATVHALGGNTQTKARTTKMAPTPARRPARPAPRPGGTDAKMRHAQALLDQAIAAVAKTASDPPLAVFDANGNLVGTVDPDKVRPLATPPKTGGDKAAAKVVANQGPQVDAHGKAVPATDAADAAAEDVVEPIAKALAGAQFTNVQTLPRAVAKAAGGSIDQRFAQLLERLDFRRRALLQDAVGLASARLLLRGNGRVSHAGAVRIAKQAACDMALQQAARGRPLTVAEQMTAATTILKSRIGNGPRR